MKPSESSENSNLLLQCGKTFPALFPQTLDEILQQSSVHFANAGRVTSRGEFLTRNISEWPSAAVVCSLSQILETWDDSQTRARFATEADFLAYLRKYYLSPKACQGILRRAERRGKALPSQLFLLLQAVAAQNAPESPEDKTP